MGLRDVAGLLTKDPNTKDRIVNLLSFMGNKRHTLGEILDATGFNERYLRFLITKLRSIRLMMGENRDGRVFVLPELRELHYPYQDQVLRRHIQPC